VRFRYELLVDLQNIEERSRPRVTGAWEIPAVDVPSKFSAARSG